MNLRAEIRFQLFEWASDSIALTRRLYGSGWSKAGRVAQLLHRLIPGRAMHPKAQSLSAQDLALLEKSFITPKLAEQAGLFRVDSQLGAELVGRKGNGDYSGIAFPYCWPGDDAPREYRLRRDHPDLEQQADGTIKEKAKYLSPPGRNNLLYFVTGTPASWLVDKTLPIVITEGEKKTMALYRLAFHNQPSPRFLPIGLSGVWNWRGRIGKTTDAQGARRDVKGVIGDLDRIEWRERIVYIIFDANVATDESVKAARRGLAKELTRRKAEVRFVDLPSTPGVNGVDDLLGAESPDYVLGLIAGAQPSEAQAERKSQATKLVELASEVELFHTPDGEPYAGFEVNGHIETWPVKSRGFRDWLTRRLYETEHKAPAAQNLQDALNVLSSRARFDGQACEVHVRIAQYDGAIYVDLVDDAWGLVKVTAEGRLVIKSGDSPVRFRRTKGMLPLPQPAPSVGLDVLRGLVNVSEGQWPLAIAWLVACYRPGKPFPVLALHGEQGSAKSTTARMLRWLVDPNKAALRSEPRDERDLMIAATNGWVVALDNLSRIPPSLSDSLCRLATGGGFGTRKLYENDEEILFDAMRPVLVNGIQELATRSDLLDRALVLTLPTIPDDKRRTEKELWSEFERERPAIFGGLLDAVSCALRNEGCVHFARLPRMADFAEWATAAEPALGLNEGEFMAAYLRNRESANDLALEAAPVSASIIEFVFSCEQWKGTASELLKELNSRTGDDVQHQRGWPKSAAAMGGALKRLAPNLRAAGVNLTHPRRSDKKGSRVIQLERLYDSLPEPSERQNMPRNYHEVSDTNSVPAEDSDRPTKIGAPASATEDGSSDILTATDKELQNPSRETKTEIVERAAIIEFDGGLDRNEAERLAVDLRT